MKYSGNRNSVKRKGEIHFTLSGVRHRPDLLWEVVDARAPLATKAFQATRREAKHHIVILGKADLAPEDEVMQWQKYFQNHLGFPCFPFGRPYPQSVIQLRDALENLFQKSGWMKLFRSMVVGIPNVGKSTLLNAIVGRRRSATGDMPGITRGPQWVRFSPRILLLDTPGVVCSSRRKEKKEWLLASLGCLKQGEYQPVPAALRLVEYLRTAPYEVLWKKLGVDAAESLEEILFMVGRKYQMKKAGGEWDITSAAEKILYLFHRGELGKVMLEELPR